MNKIERMILEVIEEANKNADSPINMLADYLKNKPLDFNNQPTRTTLSNYIDQYDIDSIFELFGDFPNVDDIINDPAYAEQVFNSMNKQMQEEFKDSFNNNSFSEDILSTDNLYDPTYKVLQFKRVIPNAKLVRFVNDNRFEQIMRNGFINMGYNNIDILGVTKFFDKSPRAEYGFLYAYEADSPEAKRQSKLYGYGKGQSYGDNFVLFKSPAIEVYHNKDHENQIIFWTANVNPNKIIFAKGIQGTDTFTVYQDHKEIMTGTYEEIIKRF